MMPEAFGVKDIAEKFDVRPQTVVQYRWDSKPGNRYEKTPFPAEDGHFGQVPYWRLERWPEVERWWQGPRLRSRPPRRVTST